MESGRSMYGNENALANLPDAKVAELSDAVKSLVEASTRLVIKLAVCDCNPVNCPLYAPAKAIAKSIDKIQMITPQQ